jgi:hypothetical protein
LPLGHITNRKSSSFTSGNNRLKTVLATGLPRPLVEAPRSPVLRPFSSSDRPSRLPLSNTARLLIGATVGGHATLAHVAKRKATPSDSKITMLQPCSHDEGESRPPSDNTQHVHVATVANGHVAPTPAPLDWKPALLRPYSGGEGTSRSPHNNTARLRVVAAPVAARWHPFPW